MPTEISVRASDPSSSSRAFPWPVLEAGNGSYASGIYSVIAEDQERGKSLKLRHQVRGAPLVEKWIASGKTKFVCSVASPRSMYRRLHVSDNPEQLVEWSRDELGEYPMFTPMIVVAKEIIYVADSATDGLSALWNDAELRLPKGARIAMGATFKLQAGISGLLDFNLGEDLAPGRYRVEPSSEDGFKFKVYMAQDLYEHLRYRRDDLAGTNIMTGVVATAFSILQRAYHQDESEDGGDTWRSFRNLVGLAALLNERGLGHWVDEQFKAEMAATSLYPHKLPPEVLQQ